MTTFRVFATFSLLIPLLVGCDVMDRLTGLDPVKQVTRDNPVDVDAKYTLRTGVESINQGVIQTVRPIIICKISGDVESYHLHIESYHLQISATGDFSTTLADDETGIVEVSHRIVSTLANHGTYYWRIKCKKSDGTESGWSNVWSFSVELPIPGGLWPSGGYHPSTPFPSFSCNTIEGIEQFEFQTALDSDFTQSPTSFVSDGNSQSPTGIADGETRYWRARVIDFGVDGDWGDSQNFQVALPILNPISPANGEAVHDIYAYWNGESIFDEGYTGYQVEINESNSFSSETAHFVEIQKTELHKLDVSLPTSKTYFWRVRLKYPNDFFGPWGTSQTFYRDAVDHTIPTPNRYWRTLLHRAGNQITARAYDRIASLNPNWDVDWSFIANTAGMMLGDDGTIYMLGYKGTQNGVFAFSPNGVESWFFSTNGGATPSSVALGQNSTVYVATRSDTSIMTVSALSAAGSLLWALQLPGTFMENGALVVGTDGTSYLATLSNLFAISSSGEILWTWATQSVISTEPKIALGKDGRIYLVDQDDVTYHRRLNALNSSGTLVWQKVAGDFSQPIVDADGTIYLSVEDSPHSGIYNYTAFLENGVQKWTVSLGLAESPILGSDHVIYVKSGKLIKALKTIDGSAVWSFQAPLPYQVDMTILPDGLLYFPDNEGILVIPTTSTGIDTTAPWPMANHDPQGTRRAGP